MGKLSITGKGNFFVQQLNRMSFNEFQRLSMFLFLLVLLVPSLQLNWQGSGNMSESNMTNIQTAINNNPLTSSSSDADLDSAAQNISTRLNSLWDPAWNVFIFRQGIAYDAVLYGYAFRNHWMWINGIPLSGDSTKALAYIIWKDYNCQRWTTFSNKYNSTLSEFSSTQINTIYAQLSSFSTIDKDVWGATFLFMKNVYTAMGDSKYSVVVSQDWNTRIGGYFCLVDSRYKIRYPASSISGTTWGYLFLFQTR